MARLKPTFASIQARAQRRRRRFTQNRNATREPAQLCAWFALCVRRATATRAHPILGAVPICTRCDAKVEWLSTPGSTPVPPMKKRLHG